jgi:DNA-directed RNA polymerase specialized sigma24 family protein
MVLRYVEDLSEAQIAEVIDAPIGTVKSLLSRARSRLSRDLALDLEGDADDR